MPENWKTYKLGDVVQYINGGAWPASSYSDSGIPVVRVSDIKNGVIDLSSCKFLDPKFKEKYSKHFLKQNDVIICTVGSHPDQQSSVVGRAGIVSENEEGAYLNQNAVILRSNNSRILDQKWLIFFAKSKIVKNHIESEARGSANQVRIAIGNLLNLDFNLPPLPEQQSIASILSAIDDKIELNLQMNKTLEEMALALYKHWFVDFGPFQDGEFVESELGEIPKGWEVKPINSIVKIYKKSFKPQDNPDLDFIHYSIPSFDKERMPIEEKGLEMKSNKTLLNSNRILASKLNPRFPRIWTVFFKSSEKIAVTSPEFINYEVKNSDDWSYANFLFRESGFYSKFHENATGSTGSRQRVQPSLTLQFSCPLPPLVNRKEFNILVNPLLIRIDENLIENQTLAQVRDTLLSKLISGEVRVKDAEKTLTEVL